MQTTINLEILVAIVSLSIAVVNGFVAIAFAYGNSEKRKITQQRDLDHFKNNLAQYQQSLNYISKELDRRFDEVDKTLYVLVSDSRNRINIKEQ